MKVMAWNDSPQAKVLQFAMMLYPDRKIDVSGYRCSPRGGKKSPYTAQVFLDGKVVVSVQDRNWRTAYKALQIELSKRSLS